jgi:acetyl-CoA carboxylase carboxyl transferase subunit beta
MSWLTNYLPPRIQTLLRKKEVPDNLWHKCPACEQMIFHRELEKTQHVCPHCGNHMRITAALRLAITFDPGPDGAVGGTRIELPAVPVDPLKFRDRRRYAERLREAQTETGLPDACVVAHGSIGGHAAVVAAFDFAFMGGSMGAAVGEALVAAARLAVLQEAALIVFPSSGGARMQEGAISLMQMPRTTAAVAMVKQARLPYIVVLTDPTTGGVTASFAMLGDLHIAEPAAMIGFAGARVIESTVREKLPEGFQRAEYLLAHGMIDMVVRRSDMAATLARVLGLLMPTPPVATMLAPVPKAAPLVAAEAPPALLAPPPES